jgi:epoxyqueuosine reductase
MASGSDTAWIVEQAKAQGFELCGVVRAQKFPELAQFDAWLERGYAGEMNYLSDPRRQEPDSALPGIRSVIVCALNYNTEQPYSIGAGAHNDVDEPRGWISRYAWGSDYHELLWAKLNVLVTGFRGRFAEPFAARAYADTGPVAERVFAKYAGLGWIGKNTLLLNEQMGSWLFLGVILTTLDLQPTLGAAEALPPDRCGTCTRCLDACPTQALVEPYVMDARRCISYLTIELKGSIPEQFRELAGRHVYGCDICQDVCPWNREAPVSMAPEFQPRSFASAVHEVDDPESLFLPRLAWLASLGEAEFRERFRGSAMKRAKWRGLVRNACNALGNSRAASGTRGHASRVALLERLATSPDDVIAESAQWALSRIK